MPQNPILAEARAFTQSTNAPVGMLRGRLFSDDFSPAIKLKMKVKIYDYLPNWSSHIYWDQRFSNFRHEIAWTLTAQSFDSSQVGDEDDSRRMIKYFRALYS